MQNAVEDVFNLRLVWLSTCLLGRVLYAHVEAHIFDHVGVNNADGDVVYGKGGWIGGQNWDLVLLFHPGAVKEVFVHLRLWKREDVCNFTS